MSLDYIDRQQEQLEKKRQLEAKKEAARVAKIEAEICLQEEIAARNKLLLEQQEDERLRQKYIQKKEKLVEQKWDNQFDTLLAQIKARAQRDDKLEEIRIIIQNREPSLQALDWESWLLSDPLNQKLADLDIERAMEMFKRDNLLAKRRHGTRGRKKIHNYVLSFTGDVPEATSVAGKDGAQDHVTTTFDPMVYELYNGFTVSYWVRPDELTGSTYYFALARKAFGPTSRFEFGITNATKIFIGVGTQRKIAALHGMSVGNWYHWVFTFAGGTNGELKAYRNGEDIDLASDGNGTSTWVDTDSDEPIFFGGRNLIGSYNNGWACTLNQVAIFDEVKDSDWVTNIYNTNRNKLDLSNENGLVGYWKFDEGSGTTVTDYSGNGNHGTFGAISGDTTAYPTWEKS